MTDPRMFNSITSNNSAKSLPRIKKGPLINIQNREHDTLNKLKGSFFGENVEKLSPKAIFNPPNITAFNQSHFGIKGSLFNEANQRQNTDMQAQLVENRVRILEMENGRMNKKIREAVKEAEKMNDIKEEQDRRFQMMQELRANREWDVEQQKLKNQGLVQNRKSNLANQKQNVLLSNQNDYSTIRTVRQQCLEEKYAIIQTHTIQQQEKFARQKSQEVRLKNMYNSIKVDRMNRNKSRYDDETMHNAFVKDQHNMRMETANKREQEMVARMAQTMNTQKQAISKLQEAIQLNKIKKAERMGASLGHSVSTNGHVRRQSNKL